MIKEIYRLMKKEKQHQRQHLNLVLLGHVDCGKSTTGGHLLYLTGAVSKDLVNKCERESAQMGKDTFKYSWIMFKLGAEKERSITIILSYNRFQTEKYDFTLIDTPGHRDFIKSTIVGTSQGDVGLLVVAAPPGEFQAGFSKDGQTRDHAIIAYTLGIKQLIVCINKMDDRAVNYSEARYDQIKDEMSQFLKKVGYNMKYVQFIPTSGFNGDNLVERSLHLEWYDGPTLIEALDRVEVPKRAVDKPLRIPIQITHRIGGVGTVIQGRVETGTLKQGTQIQIAPIFQKVICKTIEINYEQKKQAFPGDIIGINVKGISSKILKRGCVCGDPADDPPRAVESFRAQIIVLNHPTVIRAGYTPIVYCHTASFACEIVEFQSKLDKKSGAVVQEKPLTLSSGDCAMVLMRPKRSVCVQPFSEYPKLGRFVMTDMRLLIGVGVIKSVEKIVDPPKKLKEK